MALTGTCFGYLTPDEGIVPQSWWWDCEKYPSPTHEHVTWSGSRDWGMLELPYGESAVTEVIDTETTAETEFSIQLNKYGNSWFTGKVYARGDVSAFDVQATDGELAWGEVTSSPITRTWRYVQLRFLNDVPDPTEAPTPTPTPSPEPTIA
jgi:hypothetical protein